MKKQLPKPTPCVLRRETVRALDGKDLLAVAAGVSVRSLFGGRGCDPGNLTALC